MILDQKPIDQIKIAEKLSHYVGIPVADAPLSWPNNIDPFDFTKELLSYLVRSFGKESDPSMVWMGIAIANQGDTIKSVSAKIDKVLSHQEESSINSTTKKEYEEFYDAYLDHLLSRAQNVSTPGARELRGVNQSLSIAYISLNLKSSVGAEAVRAEEFLADNKFVAIRGPAGSGKTTLLNWLITRCGVDGDEKWKGFVPFLIPLRKVARLHSGPPSLDRLIEYSVDEKLWTMPTPRTWINHVLSKKKNAILMIDGVDELPSSRREEFWEWVSTFVEAYPENRVVITSRALPGTQLGGAFNEQWNPPKSFIDAQLQSMSDADVTNFVHHWHDAVDSSKLDAAELASLAEARSSLPKKLEDAANRRIRELCNTPLLCAMICVLHWREEGYLPRQRVEVYERCCDMLIEARDHKRGVLPPPGPITAMTKSDKEMVLQQLAIEMMHNRDSVDGAVDDSYRIEITREKALSWIGPQIKRFQNPEAREGLAEQVLDYLVERTGLLREPAKDLIDFPHRTFQEYLAACAAGADGQEKMLANQADDDQWHETIMLAAGTNTGGVGFGRRLIETLIKRGERNQSPKARSQRIRKTCFALALGCLENLRQQDESLREDVLSNLGQLVPPRDDSDARILSVAGDAAVSYLSYEEWKDENTVTLAACAKSLRLIATDEAVKALKNGYISDQREAVTFEVCSTGKFHYNEIPVVKKYISERGTIPSFAETSDISLITGIEEIKSISIDVKEGKNLEDLQSLGNLTSITITGLSHDSFFLDNLPVGIKKLNIQGASLPKSSWISRLSSLEDLTLIGFNSIEIESIIDNVDSVSKICIMASKFDKVDRLLKLNDLKEVYLGGLDNLDSVESLREMRGLISLSIEECKKITSIDLTGFFQDLEILNIEQINSPIEIIGKLPRTAKLRQLSLSYCTEINNIDFIGDAELVEDISVGHCSSMRDVDAISDMENIKRIRLYELDLASSPRLPCYNIQALELNSIATVTTDSFVGSVEFLEDFEAERCVKLEGFQFLEGAKSLESFSLSMAPRVSNLDVLRNNHGLKYVSLSNCDGLESIEFMSNSYIEEISLISLDNIRSIDYLSAASALKRISIINCEGLKDLSPLSSLPNLESIYLHDEQDFLHIPESLMPKIVRSPNTRHFYIRQRKPWWARNAWGLGAVRHHRYRSAIRRPYRWYP